MTPTMERVHRGAALLDKEIPGWINRIDLSRLIVSDACSCILGQTFGDFGNGVEELGLGKAGWVPKIEDRQVWDDHGFYVQWSPEIEAMTAAKGEFDHEAYYADKARVDKEYELLTETWRLYITERRLAETVVLMEELQVELVKAHA